MNPLTYTFVDCATRSVVASQPAMHLLDAVRAIKADETSQLGARLVNESYVLVSPRADVPSRSGGPWVRAATMQHDGLLIYVTSTAADLHDDEGFPRSVQDWALAFGIDAQTYETTPEDDA